MYLHLGFATLMVAVGSLTLGCDGEVESSDSNATWRFADDPLIPAEPGPQPDGGCDCTCVGCENFWCMSRELPPEQPIPILSIVVSKTAVAQLYPQLGPRTSLAVSLRPSADLGVMEIPLRRGWCSDPQACKARIEIPKLAEFADEDLNFNDVSVVEGGGGEQILLRSGICANASALGLDDVL